MTKKQITKAQDLSRKMIKANPRLINQPTALVHFSLITIIPSQAEGWVLSIKI